MSFFNCTFGFVLETICSEDKYRVPRRLETPDGEKGTQYSTYYFERYIWIMEYSAACLWYIIHILHGKGGREAAESIESEVKNC